VNERLQQIFIELTLKAEQEEYHNEGIKWEDIKFFNNKICCDLIESKKPIGLIAILDDTCNFPKGTDEKFLEKMRDAFSSHAHFVVSSPTEFTIKHYAGDVAYCVEGFCDKNKDLLYNDLIDLAQTCNTPFVVNLFPESATKDDKKRPTTAGFKIKESIGLLVNALSACTPHYIRCIKPNEKKQGLGWDNERVSHQVRYLGLLENVKVRRAGYAFRASYDRFFFRYRVCSNKTWPDWSGDSRAGCAAILESVQFEQKEFQMGTTKVFIRHPETVFAFEELRERRVWSYATSIQDFFRKVTGSTTQYSIAMNAHQKVSGKKERRRMSLERPYKGDYLNLRDNLVLKGIVEKYGEDKIHFADNVNTYDSKGKKHRRILLLTDKTIYVIGILILAADKTSKQKPITELTSTVNPFKYVLARRLELTQISSVTLSTLADNFMIMNVNQQHCQVVECRKKTELLEMMSRSCSSLRFDFKQR
jgi:myosin-1